VLFVLKIKGDDMMSLRNFYVNTITFWSSPDNLSIKKARKTEENQRLISCHDLVNVTPFLRQSAVFWSQGKRVTIAKKTWHDLV